MDVMTVKKPKSDFRKLLEERIDKAGLKAFLSEKLSNHMMPKRLKVAKVIVSHRFKKA